MRDAKWSRVSTALAGLLLGCGVPQAGSDGPVGVDGDCPVTMEPHGGAAVAKPVIVNVYWGTYWETPLAAENAFLPAGSIPRRVWDGAWAELAAMPAFWAPLDEYQVGFGSWGGSGTLEEDDDDRKPIPEERIQAALERAIAGGALPERADGIYVVYLAPGRTAAADYIGFGGSVISAHHSSYRGGGGSRRIYAVIEAWNETMGGHSVAASHEIAEAATNPDGSGLWDPRTGEEIADLCIGSESLLVPGTSALTAFFFRVAQVWSHGSCDCSGPKL
jgi:hypothetical protein